jgi:hypothetical protein
VDETYYEWVVVEVENCFCSIFPIFFSQRKLIDMSSPAEEETELQARSEIDRFTTRIIDLKQQFLGAATEGEDFFRSREEGIGNHEFKTQEGADFEAMVFGELLPATYGTKISATGNYTPMRGRNVGIPLIIF